jgi:hypothetical protein
MNQSSVFYARNSQKHFNGSKYLRVMKYFLMKKQAESCQPKLLDVSSAVDQLGQITESSNQMSNKSCSSRALEELNVKSYTNKKNSHKKIK